MQKRFARLSSSTFVCADWTAALLSSMSGHKFERLFAFQQRSRERQSRHYINCILRSLWSYPILNEPGLFGLNLIVYRTDFEDENTIVGSISDTTMHAAKRTFVKLSRAEQYITGQANSKELESKFIKFIKSSIHCICSNRQPATLLEFEILKEESRSS